MTVLKTKRLILTPMNNDELAGYRDRQTDEHLRMAFDGMLNNSINDPDNAIWHTPWKITLADSGILIGDIGFKGPQKEHTVEVGYGINEEYRNRGYATEALTAISKWALSQKDVYFVQAQTDDDNAPSIRVVQKAGFKQIGRGDDGILWELERESSSYMSMFLFFGMCLGLCFGQLMHQNISIGLSLGMCFGLAIGAILDNLEQQKIKKAKEKRNANL